MSPVKWLTFCLGLSVLTIILCSPASNEYIYKALLYNIFTSHHHISLKPSQFAMIFAQKITHYTCSLK